MVVSLFSHSTSFRSSVFFTNPTIHQPSSLFKSLPPRRGHTSYLSFHFSSNSINSPSSSSSSSSSSVIFNSQSQARQPPRTLFPSGFKRAEIKVPNLVLQLSSEEVLNNKTTVLDAIDEAVSNRVGIVVLNGIGASGGKLYEAACLLMPVIRDRAYLLIDERVDIAAAVNASGVVLSDQGLPAIVARNTMMDAKSQTVILPLVGRNVKTPSAALDASNSEGADFLIYTVTGESHADQLASSVFENVKIPVFITNDSLSDSKLYNQASDLLKSGASGLVISLEGLKLFNDDCIKKLFSSFQISEDSLEGTSDKFKSLGVANGFLGKAGGAGFVKLEDRTKLLFETEKCLLVEAINAIQRAMPLMEEVSLLVDAVSQLDEPFSLVIVGEFNSGKSTVINALLGERYLKDGVVPTTNEITFLRYSENTSGQQRCERHPDGQYICYLPAPILKDMIIVDTPGTNVILQRQQQLTEEYVPRADLLMFVMSADRPLTDSEVKFLRYTQRWNKKVIFVLNKSDLYQNTEELEEAIGFVETNAKKLLNAEHVSLYPVSARSALEAKLIAASDVNNYDQQLGSRSYWRNNRFRELEEYLYSFLDGSTSTGTERMKLKLETPVKIAEQLLSSCQNLVVQECQEAEQDLNFVNKIVGSANDYALKMEGESISRRRQILSVIATTQARVIKLLESTLRLSNLDLVTSYVFRGEKSAEMPSYSSIQNEIIGPAVLEAKKMLEEYTTWLQSDSAREARLYKQSFEKRWPSSVDRSNQAELETRQFLDRSSKLSTTVIEDFSAAAASKLFEQEIREVFLGTFGGLGAAGLSASLLTSVLPTTLEDLLALGLCSAGGLLAVSNFPARRQKMVDKVKRTSDALARQLEEAMDNDLSETTVNLENYVKLLAKPYEEKAQDRLDRLLGISNELTSIQQKLKTLQTDIQNLRV